MNVRVRCEGDRVLVIVNDRAFMDIGHRQAKELAEAVRAKALEAEEFAMRERLAADGAILLRSGAPFTLSDRPDVQAEAGKLAAWSRALRRFMPGGVKAASMVGTPTVHKETFP